MNALSGQISVEQRRLEAINRWFCLFDDVERRRDCPSSHYDELLRQAEEMNRLDLVSWEQCRDLRRLADRVFLKSIAGADYQRQ